MVVTSVGTDTSPPAGPSTATRRVRPLLTRLLVRHPVTVAAVALLWILGAATGSLLAGPGPDLLAAVGTGLGPLTAGRWWTVLTAPLWAPDLAGYLWASVEVGVLLGLAERAVGSRRVLGLAAIVQVGGTLLGWGAVGLVQALGGRWAEQLAGAVAVGPTPLAFGVALAASGVLPTLWRRRLRVLLLIALIMLVLYSGLLSDVLRLSAGLVGLLIAPALRAATRCRLRRRSAGPAADDRPDADPAPAPVPDPESDPGPTAPVRRAGVSRPESQVLLAIVVAASALGPLIAVLAESRVGPLSVLRYVFASPPPDAATVAALCTDPAAPVAECARLQGRLRLSGIGPAVLSIVPVLLLLVTAEGLRRGRRAAWLAAVGLNLALFALGLGLAANTAVTPAEQRVVLGPGTHLHSWVEIGLPVLQPLLVAVLLLITRSRFTVRARRGTYRRWLRVIGVALAATAVVFVGASLLVADQYVPVPDLPALLADLPTRYLPPGYLGELTPAFLPQGFLATLLFEWTGTVFWAVVLVAGLATFARRAPATGGTDPARLRALLAGTSGSSLAHLSTWPGQSYLFVTDDAGRDVAAVAYRVVSGVAVSTGGPVGDPAGHRAAVEAFAAHCARHGWTPCLYSVDADVVAITRDRGWGEVQVAEETVVPLAGLAFTGKKWQDVRTALNKAGKAGITAEWTSWRAAPLGMTDQIRAISEEWVADKGLPEMGFTLGGLDELDDDEVALLVAVDADRTVHGVTSWMPVRRDGAVIGWTLDFMRRRGDGFRGVMEFLIASAALHAQAEGAEFVSLSGAPLARVDRGGRPDRLQHVLDLTGRALEPVYGFASLLAFKAKFSPQYRPWYLAYPDAAALPAIGVAIGRAYLPHAGPRQLARLLRQVRAR